MTLASRHAQRASPPQRRKPMPAKDYKAPVFYSHRLEREMHLFRCRHPRVRVRTGLGSGLVLRDFCKIPSTLAVFRGGVSRAARVAVAEIVKRKA